MRWQLNLKPPAVKHFERIAFVLSLRVDEVAQAVFCCGLIAHSVDSVYKITKPIRQYPVVATRYHCMSVLNGQTNRDPKPDGCECAGKTDCVST